MRGETAATALLAGQPAEKPADQIEQAKRHGSDHAWPLILQVTHPGRLLEPHRQVLGDRLPQDVEVDVELAVDEAVGSKRVERVMRQAGLQDTHLRRKWRTGPTPQDLAATPAPDPVNRDCTAAGPDRLRVADAPGFPAGRGMFWLTGP